MQNVNVKTIINWTKTSDKEALAELYRQNYNSVYFLTLKILKNEDDALDVVQETFIAVFKNISKLEYAEAFKRWMCQIAVNKCKKFLSRNSLPLLDEDDMPLLDEVEEPDEEFIPEDALDNKESRDMIMALIDNLPDAQRTAIMLHYYEDLSVEEIAKITESSTSAIKSRLMYARAKLKNGIEAYQKKGVKLYSMAPLLGLLLKEVAKEHTIPPETAASILNNSFQGAGITPSKLSNSSNTLHNQKSFVKNIISRKNDIVGE